MDRFIYKNEIMSIPLCFIKQIDDGDFSREKHDFAIRAVLSNSDSQFNASHLRHHHIGD
jgi:hypothetical protein